MSGDTPNEEERTLKSVENAFRILEALKRLDGAGLTELADVVDMSHSSVYHYLLTMERGGYVVKRDKTYYLAVRFFSLGGYTRHKQELYSESRAKINELAEQTGETARLVVEHRGHCITLYQSSGNKTTTPNTYAGFEEKPHSTGAGKAILAALSPDRVQELLDYHEMTQRTEQTITDEDQLFRELETVQSQGYAIDDEECFEGWFCVADSITTPDGAVLGAISVSAPIDRIDTESFTDETVSMLNNATGVLGISHTYGQWESE